MLKDDHTSTPHVGETTLLLLVTEAMVETHGKVVVLI